MPQLLCKCGAPATAARLYPGTENRPVCVLCASIDRLEIPSIPERSVAIPDHLLGSKSQQIHPHNTVYNHQAVALNLLYEGHNVVVSTPTASGKTLVFMMHVLHITETDPDATAMVFYPAKALANDRLIRWKAAATAAEMDPETVQQITGDTPMRQREAILNRAKVALVTPDVVHAWLIRTARGPAQRRFSGQPPGGGHRRGTRLRGRARVQRRLHVSPPRRCHPSTPKTGISSSTSPPPRPSDPRKNT